MKQRIDVRNVDYIEIDVDVQGGGGYGGDGYPTPPRRRRMWGPAVILWLLFIVFYLFVTYSGCV